MPTIRTSHAGKRFKNKVGNVRTYLGAKEQFEEAKEAGTHYRVILSFE